PATTLNAPSGASSAFGFAVANAGDVNGDGYGDVVVGSSSSGTSDWFAYLGGPSGLAATPAVNMSETPATHFNINGAGDVNGDGYADVVSANEMLNVGANVYIHLGGSSGPSATPNTIISMPVFASNKVVPVVTALDVDGDGYWDVAVGDWADDLVRIFM